MSDMDELKQMIVDLSATVTTIAARMTEHTSRLDGINATLSEYTARFDRLDKKIDAVEDRLTQRLTVIERKVDENRTELEITRANLADIIREHAQRG